MACNKNEGMFFGTGLFESTSRRESRSFLFIYGIVPNRTDGFGKSGAW